MRVRNTPAKSFTNSRKSILPSIRLAQLRDGEEDYELLAAYGNKYGREAALHHVGRMVRDLTGFSRSAADYRAVRESLMSERGEYPFRWFRLNCDFRKAEELAEDKTEARQYIEMAEEILEYRYKDIYNP